MEKFIRLKKIWLFVFIAWIICGLYAITFFFSQEGKDILEKAGPFLIPYLIMIFLFISLILLSLSNIFEYFKGRSGNILSGIVFIGVAVHHACTGEVAYYWGFPIKNETFALLFIIGVCFLLFGIFGPVKENIYNINNLICKDCKKTFKKKLYANHKCPKCSGVLISVKSFFDEDNSFVSEKS